MLEKVLLCTTRQPGVAWSPDGRFLAIGGRLWDTGTWDVAAELQHPHPSHVTFSRDGVTLFFFDHGQQQHAQEHPDQAPDADLATRLQATDPGELIQLLSPVYTEGAMKDRSMGVAQEDSEIFVLVKGVKVDDGIWAVMFNPADQYPFKYHQTGSTQWHHDLTLQAFIEGRLP